jgi:hypothetical protein
MFITAVSWCAAALQKVCSRHSTRLYVMLRGSFSAGDPPHLLLLLCMSVTEQNVGYYHLQQQRAANALAAAAHPAACLSIWTG